MFGQVCSVPLSIHGSLAQEHDLVCTVKIKVEESATWTQVADNLFVCRGMFQRKATIRNIKHLKGGPVQACLLPACSGLWFVI